MLESRIDIKSDVRKKKNNGSLFNKLTIFFGFIILIDILNSLVFLNAMNSKNLMIFSKLLKMHETKYSPMEKADAEKIMSEILGMQCGLNPDQQVTFCQIKYENISFINLYLNLNSSV